MPPKSFYEIDPKKYLFERNTTPEEKVRQWALFELLSTYGYNINNIQIEVQCKIGRNYFPADIVLYYNNSPVAVLECKKQDETNKEEAFKQGISYANFLQAEFVVFTNGDVWLAKRRLDSEWHPVSDIPNQIQVESKKTITSTLWFTQHIEPVLYWTYQSIPKQYAHRYFSQLCNFYIMEIRSDHNLDFDLCNGIDNILRVLGGMSEEPSFEITDYRMGKIMVAYKLCGKYFDKLEVQHGFKGQDLHGYNFRELLGGLLTAFDEIVFAHNELTFKNVLLARMGSSLCKYLWRVSESNQYQDVSPNTTREIENFLDEIIKLELGVGLPESLDTGLCEELRSLTSSKWEDHLRSNNV